MNDLILDKPHDPVCPVCDGPRAVVFSQSFVVFPETAAVASVITCSRCGHVFCVSYIGQQQSMIKSVRPIGSL
jgi:hypothetical protein